MKHMSTCQVMWTKKLLLLGTWKYTRAQSASCPQWKIDCCGIASFGVFGPYFFEHNEGAAVTVTSERALRGNATQLLCTRVKLSWDWSLMGVVTARRSNSPHSKGSMSFLQETFSTACHFPWEQFSMAGTFTWSLHLWLLFMGVSQKQSFHL